MEQFGLAILVSTTILAAVSIIYFAPPLMLAVFGYLADRRTSRRTTGLDGRQNVYEIYIAIRPE